MAFTFIHHSDKTSNPSPQKTLNQPEELGKVQWHRDLNAAINLAEKEQKNILILFQEVPGCMTCRNYGNNVLSHPLIVEAIETLFIPVAIYNNKKGRDAEVLKYFNEPSWNNPVVRIVNTQKQNTVPRLGNDYSANTLVQRMLQALDLNNQVAPAYLELLSQELSAQRTGTEEATFAMYCFWTGEKELGSIDGVVSTKAGFMDRKEVVQVAYNPNVIDYETLLKKAQNARCASHVFTENAEQKAAAQKVVATAKVSNESTFRADNDPKYYLGRTHYKYVPMTSLQAARANVLIAKGQSPNTVLSSGQIALANFIQKNPKLKWEVVIDKDFEQSWKKVDKIKEDYPKSN